MTKKQKRARPSGQGAREVEDASRISQIVPIGSRLETGAERRIEASLLQWGDAKEFTKVKFDWLDALAFNADVSHTAFRLAYILASQYLSRKDGVAWPSLRTLADHIGASEKTVQEQIKLLVKEGYLKKERGGNGNSNRYRIALPDRKKTSDLQGNRPEENFRSAEDASCATDQKNLGIPTGRKLPSNPYEEPSELKGVPTAPPNTSSVTELDKHHSTAARAPDARTQPDEQVSTATETTAMIDDATNPILDRDDEPERPAADWPPEGEAFAEVQVDTDDQADDDADVDMPDLEVADAFALGNDAPDILQRFARELPDSIRPELLAFLNTGLISEKFEAFLMDKSMCIEAFLGDDPSRLDERDEELWPVAGIWHAAYEQAEARSRNSA